MREGQTPVVFSGTVFIWAAASALLGWLAAVAGPWRTLPLSTPIDLFWAAATFAFVLGLPSCALVAAFVESWRGTSAATVLGAGFVATALVAALVITRVIQNAGGTIHTTAVLAISVTPALAAICGVLLARSSRRATAGRSRRAGLTIAMILAALLPAGFVVPRMLFRSVPVETVPMIVAAFLLLVIAALCSFLVIGRRHFRTREGLT